MQGISLKRDSCHILGIGLELTWNEGSCGEEMNVIFSVLDWN